MISKRRQILITQIPTPTNIPSEDEDSARAGNSRSKRWRHRKGSAQKNSDRICMFQDDPNRLSIKESDQQEEKSLNYQESEQRQEFHKYHRLNMKNVTKGSRQKEFSRTKRKTQRKVSSINVLFERIKTEIQGQLGRNQIGGEEKSIKRVARRRMCRLKTKQQFEEEYQSYLERKEKLSVNELFRSVNREMKLSYKKNEGNIFYQNIRKDALKKIDYMHFNQKYYDDAEVKHLHSVVQSCNLVIHKKHCNIDAKPLYNMPKTQSQQIRRANLHTRQFLPDSKSVIFNRRSKKGTHTAEGRQRGSDMNNFSYQDENYFSLSSDPKLRGQAGSASMKRMVSSKGLREEPKVELNQKLSQIVSSCAQQKENLKEVKNGMKIFEFYCSRMSAGMINREAKLQNFLKWQEL